MKTITFNQSLGHLFHSINLKMRTQVGIKFAKYKLDSPHQFGMLLLLSKVPSMTQKQISDATLGDEANTTRLLTKLIKKELIKKHKNPLDKREQLVTLKPKGKELLEKLVPHATAENKRVENILTKEEYANLMNILNKINNALIQTH